MNNRSRSAVVLGGGGPVGIAWMTGFLAGIASHVPLLEADAFFGTSAGAVVAAQVATGVPLEELLARQVDPNKQIPEIVSPVPVSAVIQAVSELVDRGLNQSKLRKELAQLALQQSPVPLEQRRRVIEARLPIHEWPTLPLNIVAIDTDSGDPVIFNQNSGVSLVDAVGASCAIPLVWPAWPIDGRHYVDGGITTDTNLDLAVEYDNIFVVAPIADEAFGEEVRTLKLDHRVTRAVPSDEAALLIETPMDLSLRPAAATAGLRQGEAMAVDIASQWMGTFH